jgi:four helix bundle protein
MMRGVELPYRKLEVWQKADALALDVLEVAQRKPVVARPFLRDQMSRAATSVPANLAEGRGRRSRTDFAHFVAISRGSLYELDYWLLLCVRVGGLEGAEHRALEERIHQLSAKLAALHDALRASPDPTPRRPRT